MSQQVKKSTEKKDFYLTIISSIKSNGKLPDIKLLNTSKQNLNYYVKQLKIDGIIQKKGYGVWEIDKDKAEQFLFLRKQQVKKLTAIGQKLKTFTSIKRKIRGHGFVFKIKLPKINRWYKREHYLQIKKIKYDRVGSNWIGQGINFNKHRVWLTNKSIIVFTPKNKSYFASSSKKAKKHALYDMIEFTKKLERFMGCSFTINKKYKIRFSRQHYADINNELAKQYDREGKKLRVADFDGEWLIVDYSMGKIELETLHPKTADKDIDKVITPFLNDLKGFYKKTGETIIPSKILEMIAHITANQVVFDRNMKSHTKAIRKLGDGVDKQNNILDELVKQVKKLKN